MASSLLILMTLFSACNDEVHPDDTSASETALYFPPTTGKQWQTAPANDLGWNESELVKLLSFLETNNTRAFIVLKDGKIAVEEYWGNTVTDDAPFGANSFWYWASAGKTLTATLVGIAQQESLLNVNDKTSDYLGAGWSSLGTEKESLITIRHQLSMTTGLDFQTQDLNCTEPSCLTYRSDAGEQWYYHNAPYTLLGQVVGTASGMDYDAYSNQKIESVIGMNGRWISAGFNNIYWSTARDMARFGLLILNRGSWENVALLSNENFFNQMVSPSQQINPSYGYLWWLNGQNNITLPSSASSLNMELASNAPADLIAGIGKNGQLLDIVPSENLVVVRMGETPGSQLVPMDFHNELWQRLSRVMSR